MTYYADVTHPGHFVSDLFHQLEMARHTEQAKAINEEDARAEAEEVRHAIEMMCTRWLLYGNAAGQGKEKGEKRAEGILVSS